MASQLPMIQNMPAEEVARIVLSIAEISTVDPDVEALAKQCGLTVQELGGLLESNAFAKVQAARETQLLRFSLARGLKRMDTIVNDPKEKAANRVAAFSTIVRTYAAVRQQKPKEDDPADEFQRLMEALENSRTTKGKNGSTG